MGKVLYKINCFFLNANSFIDNTKFLLYIFFVPSFGFFVVFKC